MFSLDKQLKVGRSALGWGQRDLAKRAGVSPDTIRNIEVGKGQPKQETIDKILKTFELAGFEVSEKGIRAANAITHLKGGEGFWNFLNDVYSTIMQYGTSETPVQVFLSNVVHQNWIRSIGKEKWMIHTQRMIASKERMDVKILVKENDLHFPAQSYAQYKWVRKSGFNDRSFYSYYDKLAFLNFKSEDVEITIMRQAEFAEGYRTLFHNTWEYVAKTPPIRGEES